MPNFRPRLVHAAGAVALSVIVVGCGSSGVDEPTITQAQCRHDWENERQALAENGNPAKAGSTLAHRYDELAGRAAILATTATTKDCPKPLEDYKKQVSAFFDLEFAAREHDMVILLSIAEGDLKHATATRDYDPLPRKLARAFQVLRTEAPKARADLAVVLDQVATSELTQSSVQGANTRLEAAAKNSAAYKLCQQALGVIGNYELSEE